jgi:uncharacterized protein YprB with RNaseH-like and TPR domain
VAHNLRARLRRIRESGAGGVSTDSGGPYRDIRNTDHRAVSLPGPEWVSAGYLTAKRSLRLALPSPALPAKLPRSLGILVPDIRRYPASPPQAKDLLFFDLETTGLSTGPGTVAFLAGFGSLTGDGLRVDQYLLLDYPGENDFLEALLKELSGTAPPLTVSYNGKSFDTQLLKIRCLMNGIGLPEYMQADLLHPCRRLWKRVLPSCSQAAIESHALGLDRSGDIPGSLAPDIWFSFLKTGESAELVKVCDHNVRDIAGLLGILGALCKIAENPFREGEIFRCDLESLALWWHRAVHIHGEGPFGPGTGKTGEALLRAAAEGGHRRAAYIYYRGLALEAEWKSRNPELALRYVDLFLALSEIQDTIGNEMSHRRKRLLEKMK